MNTKKRNTVKAKEFLMKWQRKANTDALYAGKRVLKINSKMRQREYESR